jgi:hypothetical protein
VRLLDPLVDCRSRHREPDLWPIDGHFEKYRPRPRTPMRADSRLSRRDGHPPLAGGGDIHHRVDQCPHERLRAQ